MTLTKHEIDIVRLLAEGLGQKEISERIGLTRSTVENYTRYVRMKLGALNTAHIVSIAYQRGILTISK